MCKTDRGGEKGKKKEKKRESKKQLAIVGVVPYPKECVCVCVLSFPVTISGVTEGGSSCTIYICLTYIYTLGLWFLGGRHCELK